MLWLPLIFIAGLILALASWVALRAVRHDYLSRFPQVDETGPLICPYCETQVAGLVHNLGQQVHCPKCHASFVAPDHRGPAASPSFQSAQSQIAGGCFAVIGALMMIAIIYALTGVL